MNKVSTKNEISELRQQNAELQVAIEKLSMAKINVNKHYDYKMEFIWTCLMVIQREMKFRGCMLSITGMRPASRDKLVRKFLYH